MKIRSHSLPEQHQISFFQTRQPPQLAAKQTLSPVYFAGSPVAAAENTTEALLKGLFQWLRQVPWLQVFEVVEKPFPRLAGMMRRLYSLVAGVAEKSAAVLA
ncbi:MAG: hypothetical protein K2X01_03475 [Cyanobacteria bacterium]|nr:hypothetical protein [Cyanobacteriota bacterium]